MGLTKLTLLTKEETMTSRDLSIFNTLRPFSIGFDDMFDQFENMLGNGGLTMQSNYPPYNIRKTGKDNYAIEVALAGFNKNDVEVEFEDNLLTVRTKQLINQMKNLKMVKLFTKVFHKDNLQDHLQLQKM